jgi:CheY-like chemotaxis protein
MKIVLLIEDDPTLRENTAELLRFSNYEVSTASNGKKGLELANNNIPDIIICDIMMPELNGYAVLEALAESDQTKHIPFIFLSAMTERKDVRKGMNLGADDYITKPFSEEELISAIESRLAKAAILKDARENREGADETEVKKLNDLNNLFVSNGKFFSFKKDSIIYREGQNSNYIYLINKGVVKCCKSSEHGKELITALHKKDDIFGYGSFTENEVQGETATVIKETELLGIFKNELANLLTNNHKVTFELIQLLTDDLKGVKDQLLQMAYSSVHKKTAKTILKFAEKLNPKPDDPIMISRNDLASVAGIATETLIRTMSNFKRQGLIEIEGRNIKILNLNKLQDIC